jgi:dihydrofolate reductase
MSKIILDLAVSLDGFIEGPNGEYDWCIMEPDMGFETFLESVGAILVGRKSYELLMNQDVEGLPEYERSIMRTILSKKRYVFSTTMKAAPGIDIVRDTTLETIDLIKQEVGGNLWLFGGAQLVTDFVNLQLIDEYHLAVHPIILGAGKPLFTGVKDRVGLTLGWHKASKQGVLLLCYTRNDSK